MLHLPQRRLSFDCKTSKFSQQGDILGVERVSERGRSSVPERGGRLVLMVYLVPMIVAGDRSHQQDHLGGEPVRVRPLTALCRSEHTQTHNTFPESVLVLNWVSPTGSGASTYTLDSGIGTFPLPDCSGAAATRGLSKMRGSAEHSGSPGRAGRRARTLDRELPVQEEKSSAYKHPGAGVQHGPTSAVVMREGD